jgi:hypothetical protein
MTKRIYAVIFFFLPVMYTHALGELDMQSEAQYRRELGQYPITVAPISLRSRISYDYVFIDTERLILIELLQLTEINLSTGEQKIIEIPEEWAENRRNLSLVNLQYDKANNSVHIILVNGAPEHGGRTYHILHLDDYSWEAIEELGNQIESFYYDSKNIFVYIYHLTTYETESGYRRKKNITTYDLQKREIIDSVELPEDTNIVYCIYGASPKILASTLNRIDKNMHFFIYDISTGTRIDYPESDVFIHFSGSSYLTECIPVNEDGSFLCVEKARRGEISNIALLNLNTNTLEKVALENFPYNIYNFQQITEGRYSFIVATRTWAGGEGLRFLCFLDLDIAEWL